MAIVDQIVDGLTYQSGATAGLCAGIQAELESILTDMSSYDRWPHIGKMLRSLPLSAGEHLLAVNRLNSAQRYVAESQLGAAHYELDQLARKLRSTWGNADDLLLTHTSGNDSVRENRPPARSHVVWAMHQECEVAGRRERPNRTQFVSRHGGNGTNQTSARDAQWSARRRSPLRTQAAPSQ